MTVSGRYFKFRLFCIYCLTILEIEKLTDRYFSVEEKEAVELARVYYKLLSG